MRSRGFRINTVRIVAARGVSDAVGIGTAAGLLLLLILLLLLLSLLLLHLPFLLELLLLKFLLLAPLPLLLLPLQAMNTNELDGTGPEFTQPAV